MTNWMRNYWIAKLSAKRRAKAKAKPVMFDDMFPLCFVIELSPRGKRGTQRKVN